MDVSRLLLSYITMKPRAQGYITVEVKHEKETHCHLKGLKKHLKGQKQQTT